MAVLKTVFNHGLRDRLTAWQVRRVGCTVAIRSINLLGNMISQCRVPQTMERHVALGVFAFIVLQQLRLTSSETVGQVKRRSHLSVIGWHQSTSDAAMASPAEGKIMSAA